MSPPGPALDAARTQVVERGLTATAIATLTETVRGLPLDALAPVKQLLKRFFSDQPWTERDDDALAAIVGPGSGSQRLALDADLALVWGWESGPFVVRVIRDEVGLAFDSDVVPEVTPSPRTIRFATPQLHTGASRFYNAAAEAGEDPRALRLFRDFDAVTNVLVGPDFVAVTIAHARDWDSMLAPVLRTIIDEFAGEEPNGPAPSTAEPQSAAPVPRETASRVDNREPTRLARAWAELGSLRADRSDDLDRILTASRDRDAARRQVAAALLADAPADVAAAGWDDLFADANRSVRRSVIDAAGDARREALRPLLERALADPDAWTRWKAVHGIAALGVAPSRAVIEACASDPDFRVRLEAARALG
jgi:hypothetical protein